MYKDYDYHTEHRMMDYNLINLQIAMLADHLIHY